MWNIKYKKGGNRRYFVTKEGQNSSVLDHVIEGLLGLLNPNPFDDLLHLLLQSLDWVELIVYVFSFFRRAYRSR